MRHNLATVISYELRRTLLKPQFWVATVSVPLLMIFVFALSLVSGTVAAESETASRSQTVAFTYSDASGVVRPDIAATLGGRLSTDPVADAEAVRQGKAELFIGYPADPRREPVTVLGRDIGLTDSGRYTHIAVTLLHESALSRIDDPVVRALATAAPSLEASTWKDGVQTPGWGGVILPGLFLVLLYMTVLMLGSQMLNITVEEKENRVTEMILTTIHPTSLIVGKVVALVLVGFVQLAVFMGPLAVLQAVIPAPDAAASATPEDGGFSFSAGQLTVAPVPIAIAALLFLGGFLMFTGLLVAIGSIMPTAKDAAGAFSVVLIAMFVPLYTFALIVAQPESVASRVLTFFPLTAPVTALLRNATGSLGPLEAVAALVVIFASGTLFLWAGVRLFAQGSISYDAKLSLRKVLRIVK